MAAKLKDGLFIGDYEAAHDYEFLMTNKITHIINCAGREVENGWESLGVRCESPSSSRFPPSARAATSCAPFPPPPGQAAPSPAPWPAQLPHIPVDGQRQLRHIRLPRQGGRGDLPLRRGGAGAARGHPHPLCGRRLARVLLLRRLLHAQVPLVRSHLLPGCPRHPPTLCAPLCRDLDKTMQFLTSKRPDLCPIPNFYRQLLYLDQRLHQQFAALYPSEQTARAKRSEWSIAAVGAWVVGPPGHWPCWTSLTPLPAPCRGHVGRGGGGDASEHLPQQPAGGAAAAAVAGQAAEAARHSLDRPVHGPRAAGLCTGRGRAGAAAHCILQLAAGGPRVGGHDKAHP